VAPVPRHLLHFRNYGHGHARLGTKPFYFRLELLRFLAGQASDRLKSVLKQCLIEKFACNPVGLQFVLPYPGESGAGPSKVETEGSNQS
jgi:hypothetical protein